MFLFWRAVNLQMNRTVKYQGAFSRIVGFAGKRFLFSPPPPPSTFFFCSRSNFRAITRLETLATQATYFDATVTYDWHCARHCYFMIKFWSLLQETFNSIYDKNDFRTFKKDQLYARAYVRIRTLRPCWLKNRSYKWESQRDSTPFKKSCQSVWLWSQNIFCLFVCFYTVS